MTVYAIDYTITHNQNLLNKTTQQDMRFIDCPEVVNWIRDKELEINSRLYESTVSTQSSIEQTNVTNITAESVSEDSEKDFINNLARIQFTSSVLCFLLGIFGNSLMITIVVRNILKTRNLSVNASHMWILNLAISDLLTVMLSIPLHTIIEVQPTFTFGTFVCIGNESLSQLCDWVSMCSVFVMATTRAVGIMYPFDFAFLRRKYFNNFAITLTWVTGIICTIPYLMNMKVNKVCDIVYSVDFWPKRSFETSTTDRGLDPDPDRPSSILITWQELAQNYTCNFNQIIPNYQIQNETKINQTTIGDWFEKKIKSHPEITALRVMQLIKDCSQHSNIRQACAYDDVGIFWNLKFDKKFHCVIWSILSLSIIFMYSGMAVKLKRKNGRSSTSSSGPGFRNYGPYGADMGLSSATSARKRGDKGTARVTLIVSLITINYIVCWLPWKISIFLNLPTLGNVGYILHLIKYILKYFNHIANPIICISASENFRHEAKYIISCGNIKIEEDLKKNDLNYKDGDLNAFRESKRYSIATPAMRKANLAKMTKINMINDMNGGYKMNKNLNVSSRALLSNMHNVSSCEESRSATTCSTSNSGPDSTVIVGRELGLTSASILSHNVGLGHNKNTHLHSETLDQGKE